MSTRDYVDAADISSAGIRLLALLTQEAEASIGLVDMTIVRLEKLFEIQPNRRGCVLREAGVAVGWVAVRVDGCTGVLTADQSVLASPSETSRAGIADELVETAGRMAMEIAAVAGTAGPGESVRLRFEVPRGDAVMREALSRRGARVVHHWQRLRADINDALRRFPEQPPNVEVKRVDTEEDFAAHHRIRNVGYSQLSGDRVLTREEWRDQLLDEPGNAPDSWLLAYLDGRPAGMLAASLSRAELGAVYISHAATLPEARGSRCNIALNRAALKWGLAQGLKWSRYRAEAEISPPVGEVDPRGYLAVDTLDIWELVLKGERAQ